MACKNFKQQKIPKIIVCINPQSRPFKLEHMCEAQWRGTEKHKFSYDVQGGEEEKDFYRKSLRDSVPATLNESKSVTCT